MGDDDAALRRVWQLVQHQHGNARGITIDVLQRALSTPKVAALLVENAALQPLARPGTLKAAFNLGNALGAWAGGVTIDRGLGLGVLPLVAAVITAIGLLLALWSLRLDRPAVLATQCPAE